jgi:predicted RNase H-like nuclease (RuvC/YqgF family)
MDLKIKSEIKKLVYNRDLYHSNYVEELEEFETKIQRLDAQADRTESEVKKQILTKQKEYYERQIEKLDKNLEITTNAINQKIEYFEEQLQNLEKEKRSLDYNVEKLKKALERRNTNEIFDMFEYVTNAIMIIQEDMKPTSSKADEHA